MCGFPTPRSLGGQEMKSPGFPLHCVCMLLRLSDTQSDPSWSFSGISGQSLILGRGGSGRWGGRVEAGIRWRLTAGRPKSTFALDGPCLWG